MAESGERRCGVCGLAFAPRDDRQVTCGAPDCVRENRRRITRDRARVLGPGNVGRKKPYYEDEGDDDF